MTAKELEALSPDFGWNVYLTGIGAPSTQVLNVTEPDFFKQFDATVKSTSLDDWKTYLRWHVLHSSAACCLPSSWMRISIFSARVVRDQGACAALETLRAVY